MAAESFFVPDSKRMLASVSSLSALLEPRKGPMFLHVQAGHVFALKIIKVSKKMCLSLLVSSPEVHFNITLAAAGMIQ